MFPNIRWNGQAHSPQWTGGIIIYMSSLPTFPHAVLFDCLLFQDVFFKASLDVRGACSGYIKRRRFDDEDDAAALRGRAEARALAKTTPATPT